MKFRPLTVRSATAISLALAVVIAMVGATTGVAQASPNAFAQQVAEVANSPDTHTVADALVQAIVNPSIAQSAQDLLSQDGADLSGYQTDLLNAAVQIGQNPSLTSALVDGTKLTGTEKGQLSTLKLALQANPAVKVLKAQGTKLAKDRSLLASDVQSESELPTDPIVGSPDTGNSTFDSALSALEAVRNSPSFPSFAASGYGLMGDPKALAHIPDFSPLEVAAILPAQQLIGLQLPAHRRSGAVAQGNAGVSQSFLSLSTAEILTFVVVSTVFVTAIAFAPLATITTGMAALLFGITVTEADVVGFEVLFGVVDVAEYFSQLTEANEYFSGGTLGDCTVAPPFCPLPAALTITTVDADLGTAVENTPYLNRLQAVGGTAPYAWVVPATSLPPGITIDPNSGVLSGTPTNFGTYSFDVTVGDSTGATAYKTLDLTVAPALQISTTTLGGATQNIAYSDTLQAIGGIAPYSWSIASGSALPSGLKLGKTTGTISGTPTAAGPASFTLTVTDSQGSTASEAFSLTVAGACSSGCPVQAVADGGGFVTVSWPDCGCESDANNEYVILPYDNGVAANWSVVWNVLTPGESGLPTSLVLGGTGEPMRVGDTYTFQVGVWEQTTPYNSSGFPWSNPVVVS